MNDEQPQQLREIRIQLDDTDQLQSEEQQLSPFQRFANNQFVNKMPDMHQLVKDQVNQMRLAVTDDDNKKKIMEEYFVSGGESLLTKMGGMLIAKAYLPTGSHIKQALSYLDLAIKVEIVLQELQSTLFWLSLLEAGLFLVSMLLFFTDPVEMVYIWYHVPHCFRCVLGLALYQKVPRSHQMAAQLSIPIEEKIEFDSLMTYILQGAKDALSAFTSSTKSWLICYFILTIVQLFLDLITFFTQVRSFGTIQSAYADLALIIIASIFLFCDWYYILWLMTLTYKLPSFMSTAFIKAMLGMIESIHARLGNIISQKKSRYQNRENQEKNKLQFVQKQKAVANYPDPGSSHGSSRQSSDDS